MIKDSINENNRSWKSILLFSFVLQVILPGVFLLLIYFLIKRGFLSANIFVIIFLVLNFLIIPIGLFKTLRELLSIWKVQSLENKKSHKDNDCKKRTNQPFIVTDILDTHENHTHDYDLKYFHSMVKKIFLFFKVSLVLIIIFSSLFYFTYPNTIVIKENGKVSKISNKLRAICQGKKFWDYQYNLAINRYRRLSEHNISFYQEMTKISQNHRAIERSNDDVLDTYYSEEQKLALSLRRQADSIEDDFNYRSIEKSLEERRLSEIKKLSTILSIIELRQYSTKKTLVPKLIAYSVSLFVLAIFFSNFKINITKK